MKTKLYSIFLTFILFSSVYLPLSVAQDYTTWNLPEGAKARLGKGTIEDIQFSPDNKLLAVAGSIGVWIYDVDTDEELALLTGHTGIVTSVAFSPDGETLASGSWDYTIRLWNDIQIGSRVWRSGPMTRSLRAGVGIKPSVSGMSSEVNTNRPSRVIRIESQAYRSARIR